MSLQPRNQHQETNYGKALEYYYTEDFYAALQALFANNSGNLENLKELILSTLIHIDTLDLSDAEICLQQLQNRFDILPEAQTLEAMLKEAKGDHNGAIMAYQAAIFLDKDFFVPHFRLAQIHQSIGETNKALRHFNNALRVLRKDEGERVRLFCGGASKGLLEEICKKRIQLGI